MGRLAPLVTTLALFEPTPAPAASPPSGFLHDPKLVASIVLVAGAYVAMRLLRRAPPGDRGSPDSP